MKKKSKKLVLAKETVRSLAEAELWNAAGAATEQDCNSAARHCVTYIDGGGSCDQIC